MVDYYSSYKLEFQNIIFFSQFPVMTTQTDFGRFMAICNWLMDEICGYLDRALLDGAWMVWDLPFLVGAVSGCDEQKDDFNMLN